MSDFGELREYHEELDLINVLPELEGKLKSIQRFLRKVTRGKSPEKIREMLPLMGFSLVGDNIEYDFGGFSVRFPLEKCCNNLKTSMFNSSEIGETLADNLMKQD